MPLLPVLPAKAAFLLVSVLLVLLPWLLWRVGAVRRVAPLAVVQILVGIALGPTGLGHALPGMFAAVFRPPVLAAVDGVAGLGVLLYVFVAGMHLHAGTLRRQGRGSGLGLGAMAAGSVALPLLLGAGAGLCMMRAVPDVLGPEGDAAAFVGAVAICISVTALPVLAAILGELNLLRTELGQAALALAALNDAALWLMLAGLLAYAGVGGSGAWSLAAAAAILGAVLLGTGPLLARLVPGRLTAEGETLVLVAGVALALGTGAVSEWLGTGYLIGAFAAGVAIPLSWRPVLLNRLEPVTAAVLLPFFFMSTGLKAFIEPGSGAFLLLLALATGATVVGKLLGTALPARGTGLGWRDGLALGAMMQAKGLMEVVVLAVLHDAGLIGTRIFSAMVAMAVLCTVATAPAVRLLLRRGAVRAVA